jgi:hypothetical protein
MTGRCSTSYFDDASSSRNVAFTVILSPTRMAPNNTVGGFKS